ncbi:hypothetical protein pb186bvf_011795 [Paramecium bursaria]
MNKQFAQFLLDSINQEKNIEQQRELLARNMFFEPYTAFSRLDYKMIGYVDTSNIKLFMDENFQDVSTDDCSNLIRRMDSDKDFYVAYSDFCRYIMPFKDEDLQKIADLRQAYRIENQKLPTLVEERLAKIFQLEINKIRSQKEKLQILINEFDTDGPIIHALVNKGKSWDDYSIQTFIFQNLQHRVSLEDAQLLVFRLDKDKDYKIGYPDFVQLISQIQQNPKKIEINSQFTPQRIKNLINTPDKSTNVKSESPFVQKAAQKTPQKSPQILTELKQENPNVSDFTDNFQVFNKLKEIMEQTKIREDSKLTLAQIQEEFFEIDRTRKGYFTLEDLQDYFQSRNLNYSLNHLIGLIKLFDYKKDGIVDFQEFHNAIQI